MIEVWVVHFSTKHGDDYRVFKTEERAREQIKSHLLEYEIIRGSLFDNDKPDASTGNEWYLLQDEYVVLSKEYLLE